ncbi:MAG: AmmeMemoRadiSam system protein B [Planctomycetes bacterium]|nr:AmmeMemoRadiSam system protein B [Planctomycetota bacterium]
MKSSILLMSLEFHSELFRVLKPYGRLFHYCPTPRKTKGKLYYPKLIRRLKDAGFNRVIILAPSHFMSGKRFRGVSILKVKNFKTPLGVIPVDEDACNQLLNTSKELKPDASHQAIKLFGSYEGAYKGEHSLETQLPFLQTAINTFKVVPIIIGVLIDNDYDQVADTIRPLMDDKTLLVVSSDTKDI